MADVNLFPHDEYARQLCKNVSARMLIRGAAGWVLLAQPSYRDGWETPAESSRTENHSICPSSWRPPVQALRNRTYGTYWVRMTTTWGNRRLDELLASDIEATKNTAPKPSAHDDPAATDATPAYTTHERFTINHALVPV